MDIKEVIYKDLIPVVVKTAPVLAGIIGGPVGSAAVSLIAAMFGTEAKDIPALIDKISTDPQSEEKLKQIETVQIASIPALIFSHLPLEAKINFNLEWKR